MFFVAEAGKLVSINKITYFEEKLIFFSMKDLYFLSISICYLNTLDNITIDDIYIFVCYFDIIWVSLEYDLFF